MKPENLKTKIFLDSGDPNETRGVLSRLGFLDGQTTNPSLVFRRAGAKGGKVATFEESLDMYKHIVREISGFISDAGSSVSVEVHADAHTTADEMLSQAKQMYTWIENAHIKFPITREGLLAAKRAVSLGMRVNMTLCFSQSQAAAVYKATKGAKKGDVFVSPFVGRLDDQGVNGMDLIKNILTMYRAHGDGHVEVLAASIRSIDHLLASLVLGCDIVTAPGEIFLEWAEQGMSVPGEEFRYMTGDLKPIPYEDLTLDLESYDITHELTDVGLKKFASDWNTILVS